ncbi:MAG: flagellin hook IN motif-containing protein [Pirellulaceae bacterium]
MSRIAATVSSFQQMLLNQLERHRQASAQASFRLTTGSLVNFPSDDPSAFPHIQLLQHQQGTVQDVARNIDAAATIAAESQTTLDEIQTQLDTIETQLLLDEEGDLTPAERNVAQTASDQSLATIRDLVRTPVNGVRYLDGSVDYSTSGKNAAQIRQLDVFSLDGETSLSGTVSSAATQASVTYTGGGGSVINSGDATFTLTGQRGATAVGVTNGEPLTAVRDRINADSHDTGITASVAGNNLVLTSVDYGTNAVIDIELASGSFTTAGSTAGTDAAVTLNGTAISADDVDGNTVSFHEQGVHVQLELVAGYTGAISSITLSSERAARFAISPRAGEHTALFAVGGLFPEQLGGLSGMLSDLESGGDLDGLASHTAQALRVVQEARDRLTLAKGRVDAFAEITIASAGRWMDGWDTNLEDALTAANGIEEEAELVNQSRYESLATNAITSLAISQQYQASLVALLQNIAGL